MKNIKVIKKDAIFQANDQTKAVEERKSPPESKANEAIKTVQNWIIEWRSRTESESRRAFNELRSLKA